MKRWKKASIAGIATVSALAYLVLKQNPQPNDNVAQNNPSIQTSSILTPNEQDETKEAVDCIRSLDSLIRPGHPEDWIALLPLCNLTTDETGSDKGHDYAFEAFIIKGVEAAQVPPPLTGPFIFEGAFAEYINMGEKEFYSLRPEQVLSLLWEFKRKKNCLQGYSEEGWDARYCNPWGDIRGGFGEGIRIHE